MQESLRNAKPLPTISDLVEEPIPKTEEEIIERLDSLKPEINKFLYQWLPPKTTIDEMESIGCSILLRIHEEWQRKAGLR